MFITLSEKLIAISFFLQALELRSMQPLWNDSGIWKWGTLKKDFGKLSPLLWSVFSTSNFSGLITAQMLLSVALIFFSHPLFSISLFITSVLICIRFRGTLNGGSDFMSIIVIAVVAIFHLQQQPLLEPFGIISKFALYYLCVQLTLSYFIAGVSKVRDPAWRSGYALSVFSKFKVYQMPVFFRELFQKKGFAFAASWSVLLFELSFPVVWVIPQALPIYLLAGAGFHLFNAYLLGLNRFFWAWLAAYPILFGVLTTRGSA